MQVNKGIEKNNQDDQVASVDQVWHQDEYKHQEHQAGKLIMIIVASGCRDVCGVPLPFPSHCQVGTTPVMRERSSVRALTRRQSRANAQPTAGLLPPPRLTETGPSRSQQRYDPGRAGRGSPQLSHSPRLKFPRCGGRATRELQPAQRLPS